MTKQEKYIAAFKYLLLTGILVYGYYFLVLGALHSHPNAEDLALTALPLQNGIWPAIQEVLLTYDGRYFTNFLHGANPIAFGWIDGYKWLIIIGLLIPILCLYLFLSTWLQHVNKGKIALFSSLFLLINYTLSPSLVHLIYWLVSSYVYLYSWCLCLLWLTFLAKFFRSTKESSKYMYFILCNVVLFAAMGINELYLIINLVLLGVIFLYLLIEKRRQAMEIIPILLTGLFSFLFFVSNPGISRRFKYYEGDHSEGHIGDLIPMSLSHFFSELFNWHTQHFILIPFLVFALLYLANNKLGRRISTKVYLLLLLIFIGIYVSLLAFYLPMGEADFVPNRIYTTIFLCVQLLFLFVLVNRINISLKPKLSNAFQIIILIWILARIIGTENNISILKQEYQSGEIEQFDKEMTDRYQFLLETSMSNECWKHAEIDLLSVYPSSIYSPPEINPNRSMPYWNIAYERYFGIDECSLSGDAIRKLKKWEYED